MFYEVASQLKKKQGVRLWKLEVLHGIMQACIILHNMFVEDVRYADEVGKVSFEIQLPSRERGSFGDFTR